ncbi:MAG: hypothetical protein IPP48_06365 [Chitinophagaceae bacterium]|nr:hypothetical protein [Chitinophagaceae bacterium]
MKITFINLLLTVSLFSYGQSQIAEKYKSADSLLQANNFSKAYLILKEIEPKCDTKDTLYNYILWYYVGAATELEKKFRDKEIFDSSLYYGLETLKLIEKGKGYFDEKFSAREYWMTKNIIVSYFGLGQLDNAKKYKDILYAAYKEKKLPKNIDQYFNFTFFKWDNKNVWGYEWFEEIPENRFEKSFSKVVYYVYSTKPDGSDNEQLYRLQVLMFHKSDASVKFDYVLTKRLETAKNEVSGTLYAYTYDKNIDFAKLQADIREVLKGNYQPDTKTITNKQ